MKRRLPLWILIAILCLVNLVPIWLLFKQAFTPDIESLAWPPKFFPHQVTLENFKLFIEGGDVLNGLSLSFWVAISTAVLSLIIGTLAGWSIARAQYLGNKVLSATVLTRIFPSISLAIPLAIIFIRIGFYNHPQGIGLIFAHSIFVLPFTTLVAYSTFKAIPRQLEEQALVDGCSGIGALFRVTLPLARAGMGTAFILSFILSWDEFTYSIILQITNRNLPPLVYYYSAYGNVGIASAISCAMLIPALGIVFIMQRFIRAGYVRGAIR